MTDQTAATLKRDTAFVGHPWGLFYLVFSEAFERFSYYGMRAILTLYLAQQLLLPGHVEKIIGFGWFHHLLEGIYGPLKVAGMTSVIVGLYGFTYLTPLFGGLIADRWLGRRNTITLGAVVMAFGHFLMAFEQSFLIALACILIGVGCFKGNISSQVGALYGPKDSRRGTAFQIFYLVFNIAVIVAPIVCGTLGQKIAWHWGFGAAGISMVLGLLVYLSGTKYLPVEPARGKAARAEAELNGTHAFVKGDGVKIILLLAIVPLLALSLVMNEQVFNNYLSWANDHMNFHLLGYDLPSSWLVSLDATMGMLFLSGSIVFWKWWSAKWQEPDEMAKIAIAACFAAVAPLALSAAALTVTPVHKASLWWAILFEVINSIGFANLAPVALALFSRAAPPRVNGMMIGVCMLSFFGADIIAGALGQYLEPMGAFNFWLLHAGLVGVAAIGLLIYWRLFGRKLLG